MALSYTEKKIVDYLERWHTGASKATTFSRLAGNLKIGERDLREIVSRLVTIEEQLIGSTSLDGYFWIETKEDFEHVDRELTARITSLILRRSGLRRGWAEKTKGQQKLFEEAL